MRVLVTGSRDWPYPEVIWTELDKVMNQLIQRDPFEQLVVIEGACPKGADLFAYQWVDRARQAGHPVISERYPADWTRHGKAAGFLRNQQMVDKGADLCLAFRFMGSNGTRDCMNRATLALIPLRALELDLVELQ